MAKKNTNPKNITVETATNQFVLDGKKYNVLKAAVVPLGNGAETLTAADICVHEEAQKYLVEHGASCIEEVTE